MEVKGNFENIYKPSEDIVAREIQGELIIIPVTQGVGDLEDEIFTLNATARAIWDKLDGKRSLKEIAEGLVLDYDSAHEEIEKDIMGFTQELLKRRMLVEVTRG